MWLDIAEDNGSYTLCKSFFCRGRSRMQGRGASPMLPLHSTLAAPHVHLSWEGWQPGETTTTGS